MDSSLATYLIVGTVALLTSGLTLFSGFGLGTLLMPAFALFFPIPVAVAATAGVHVLNNLFKLTLLWRNARGGLLVAFGVPAVVSALAGAWALAALPEDVTLRSWRWGTRLFRITPLDLTMGVLIAVFGLLELLPILSRFRPGRRWIPLGGVIAGFFGGLSGHQGAFRAAFLAPLGLPPAAFVATSAVLACMVDFARLAVYGATIFQHDVLAAPAQARLIGFATLCAFAGAYMGRMLLPSVTVAFVRKLTGILLLWVGAGIACGLFSR